MTTSGKKISLPGLMLVAFCLFADATSTLAQRNACEIKPVPMRRSPPDAHFVHWHSIQVAPKSDLPEIHFYDKLNPVWWLENADDPAPPPWYQPDAKHRKLDWRFRNPFHNFDFYVIGVVDKNFVRSGHYPKQNSNPDGGWDFEVVRRKIVLLPFISYERSWITFYFGWREHGAFGMEMKFHRKKPSVSSPKAEN